MKIYISADIEGVAGIVAWEEAGKDSADYEQFRLQMTDEVAAACHGAIEAGASEIWVKDAHGSGRNIYASELPDCVRLIRGWSGHPLMMMQELDDSFDAALMVGYHAAGGVGGNPLGHSFSSSRVMSIRINGDVASEFLCSSFAAQYVGVPVVYVSGDETICAEARALDDEVVTTAVSRGVGGSSVSINPHRAVAEIKRDVKECLASGASSYSNKLPEIFKTELQFKDHANAYRGSFYPGASLKDAHTVRFESIDYMEILKFFLFVI